MRAIRLCVLAKAAVLSALSLVPARSAYAQEAPRSESPAPEPNAGESRSEPVAGSVWVHVDGTATIEIQRDLDSVHNGAWETICTAPCDRLLASDLRYRVTGGGLRTSDPFALAAQDGARERIGVRGGSKAWFILGWIGIGVGGAAAVVGLDVLIAPLISSSLPGADGRTGTSAQPGHPLAGWSLVGGGVALAATGLAIMIQNRRTTVTQDATTAPTARPDANERAERRAGRDVAAHDDAREWPPIHAMLVPIVRVAF